MVEEVELRGGPALEQVDDPLDAGRSVGRREKRQRPAVCGCRRRLPALQEARVEERAQRRGTQAQAARREEPSPVASEVGVVVVAHRLKTASS